LSLEARPNQSPPEKTVTVSKGALALVVTCLISASIAPAQSQTTNPQIVTLRLGPDQIGAVKTAEKFSTRLAFREPIKEIVCGDLYDPESGTGAFVIQRIDNNVFIKPVAPRGNSNMFVKTGERGERIYNFSLLIVPINQAHFIVNVINTSDNVSSEIKASKHLVSLPVSPPIIANIKMNEGGPDNAIGGMAAASSVKLSRMAEPAEPPPPPPKMKSNSRPAAVVARLDGLPQRDVIKRVKPNYPQDARLRGISGEVIVEITIDDSGKVISGRAISGPLWLRNAAVLAARDWKFSPATPTKWPTLDVSRITFNFQFANY
jgi:TonB family protein